MKPIGLPSRDDPVSVLQEVSRRINARVEQNEPGIDARDWCDRDCRWFTVARHLAGWIVETEAVADRLGEGEQAQRVLGQGGLLREAELAADLLAEARRDHGRNQ